MRRGTILVTIPALATSLAACEVGGRPSQGGGVVHASWSIGLGRRPPPTETHSCRLDDRLATWIWRRGWRRRRRLF